ncbi:MAG: tRNA glutamyl-Q(34) synthetase GluQRS [Solirubrobacterales bacterium]
MRPGEVPGGRDGRYAPSPTGELHLGNLRTAMVAWLFARHAGARLSLRVEDLDTQRSRPEHEAGQLRDLSELGVHWDGPVTRQSEHRERFDEAVAALRDSGHLYRCYCTRREIRDAASAPHGALPEGAYPGTCRALDAAARARHERDGRPAAWRLRAPWPGLAFDDRLAGRFEGAIDDVVVVRNDGTPSYNLAVVVDDAADGVGEVVRGADLLDTTPRQIAIARLLDLPVPSYAHVPLVLGPDGQRLAKRHGSVSMSARRQAGESPAAVRARLGATLGLCRPEEPVTMAELLERFDPGHLTGEPVVLDHEAVSGVSGPG